MATFQITLDIEKLDEGPYLGTSPDLPGLIIQANSPEEVISLAPDIARDLIEVMRDAGQSLPPQIELKTMPQHVCLAIPA